MPQVYVFKKKVLFCFQDDRVFWFCFILCYSCYCFNHRSNEMSKYKNYHLIFKISIKEDKIPTMNFDENVWIISTKDYIYFPKGKYICLAGWNIRMTVCGEAGRRNWSWNLRRRRKREEWSLVLGFTTNLFGEMQIQIRYFFGFEFFF